MLGGIINFRLILKLMFIIIRIVPRGHILLKLDSSGSLVDVNCISLVNVVSDYLDSETLEGENGDENATNHKKH